jgi:hypothetical protein
VVLCLEPAVVGAAQLGKWPEFDHGMFLWFEFFSGFELRAEAAVDIEHGAGHE